MTAVEFILFCIVSIFCFTVDSQNSSRNVMRQSTKPRQKLRFVLHPRNHNFPWNNYQTLVRLEIKNNNAENKSQTPRDGLLQTNIGQPLVAHASVPNLAGVNVAHPAVVNALNLANLARSNSVPSQTAGAHANMGYLNSINPVSANAYFHLANLARLSHTSPVFAKANMYIPTLELSGIVNPHLSHYNLAFANSARNVFGRPIVIHSDTDFANLLRPHFIPSSLASHNLAHANMAHANMAQSSTIHPVFNKNNVSDTQSGEHNTSRGLVSASNLVDEQRDLNISNLPPRGSLPPPAECPDVVCQPLAVVEECQMQGYFYMNGKPCEGCSYDFCSNKEYDPPECPKIVCEGDPIPHGCSKRTFFYSKKAYCEGCPTNGCPLPTSENAAASNPENSSSNISNVTQFNTSWWQNETMRAMAMYVRNRFLENMRQYIIRYRTMMRRRFLQQMNQNRNDRQMPLQQRTFENTWRFRHPSWRNSFTNRQSIRDSVNNNRKNNLGNRIMKMRNDGIRHMENRRNNMENRINGMRTERMFHRININNNIVNRRKDMTTNKENNFSNRRNEARNNRWNNFSNRRNEARNNRRNNFSNRRNEARNNGWNNFSIRRNEARNNRRNNFNNRRVEARNNGWNIFSNRRNEARNTNDLGHLRIDDAGNKRNDIRRIPLNNIETRMHNRRNLNGDSIRNNLFTGSRGT